MRGPVNTWLTHEQDLGQVETTLQKARALGDGCTTLGMYSVTLNRAFNMVKMVNVILCIFCHNFKNWEEEKKQVLGWTRLGWSLLASALFGHCGCSPCRRLLVGKSFYFHGSPVKWPKKFFLKKEKSPACGQFRTTALYFHRVRVKMQSSPFTCRAGNMEYAMGLEEAFLFCKLQPCPSEGRRAVRGFFSKARGRKDGTGHWRHV